MENIKIKCPKCKTLEDHKFVTITRKRGIVWKCSKCGNKRSKNKI